MASISKRGNKYLCEIKITINYIVHRESKTFDSKMDAMMWAQTREKEIREGNTDSSTYTTKKHSLKDALERYRDEVSIKKRGAKWETARINKFLRDPDLPIKLQLSKLKTDHFNIWRESKKDLADSSKNREVTILKSVLETARREWQWLDKNPLNDLRKLSDPAPRNRRISQIEIDLITEDLDFNNNPPSKPRHYVAIAFLIAIETAMRLGEITNLDWSNVNLDRRYLTLLSTKNGDKRDVPLSKRAIELFTVIGPLRKGAVFEQTADAIGATFRNAVRRCKIEDLTFHDTRHEACTRLAQKISVLDLARIIGHRDLKSLMIYYNPTAEELAARLG